MTMHPAVSNGAYDVARVREDFPALALKVYGKQLVYLDNAASAQKPTAVLDRMTEAYKSEYANVHRGLHYLANAATEAYEGGRAKVAKFLNAGRTEEIIFTRNATEAINLVASSWGEPNIKAGDEIVISIMEHHSNIVPWHFLRERHGAVIKWAPVDDEGNFLIEEFEKLLTDRTKLVAITQMSNALGTIVPVKDVVKLAHARGIPVLVDGSQAAVHLAVDVQDIDCDFYVFTGHKLYGPTGIGVLYAKHEHLVAMRPFNGGGEMIREVARDWVTYGDPAAQVRGGYAGDRGIDRAGRCDRLRQFDRQGADRRPRTRPSDLCSRAPARNQLAAPDRHRARQGTGDLLRDEGGSRSRCRNRDRPARDCGARRHPLRDAAFRAVQCHSHLPGVVWDV